MTSDLSPEMQDQCRRVQDQAVRFIVRMFKETYSTGAAAMTADPYSVIRTGNCNCMGRFASSWFPYRKDGDVFYTPSGLKGLVPPEWRMVDAEAIIAEMKACGNIPYVVGTSP